jgi:hypothetical protein
MSFLLVYEQETLYARYALEGLTRGGGAMSFDLLYFRRLTGSGTGTDRQRNRENLIR